MEELETEEEETPEETEEETPEETEEETPEETEEETPEETEEETPEETEEETTENEEEETTENEEEETTENEEEETTENEEEETTENEEEETGGSGVTGGQTFDKDFVDIPNYKYDEGNCPDDGDSDAAVPCAADLNLDVICDKYQEGSSFTACWEACIPSFCCIHGTSV